MVHTGEPEVMTGFVVGGHYPTVLNRHVFETLAMHGQLALHIRVLAAATRTTSPRRSSRPWPARCGRRSSPTRG
jgi:hypothetical protein